MLLDPSGRIRDYAAYILEKRADMDIRAFYLKELARNPSKFVLSGIGEHGMKDDAEIIRPYLEESRDSIPEHIRKGILFDLKCVERG